MIENWILADHELMAGTFGKAFVKRDYEGMNGKKILSNFLLPTIYKETVHGVKLLKKVSVERAANNSHSLKRFLDILDMDCWWVGNS